MHLISTGCIFCRFGISKCVVAGRCTVVSHCQPIFLHFAVTSGSGLETKLQTRVPNAMLLADSQKLLTLNTWQVISICLVASDQFSATHIICDIVYTAIEAAAHKLCMCVQVFNVHSVSLMSLLASVYSTAIGHDQKGLGMRPEPCSYNVRRCVYTHVVLRSRPLSCLHFFIL